jgi:phosphoribosylamine--glycine ligase
MKVLVCGSGGRDHCLADNYADSQHVDEVYLVPGNPGVLYTPKGQRGSIKLAKVSDFAQLIDLCVEKKVDLVDVGSENPLKEGLIDALTSKGIPCVGPLAQFVAIEDKRSFTNALLDKFRIPKPRWMAFTDPESAKKHIRNVGYQVVVKDENVAAGKGSLVCEDASDACQAVDDLFAKQYGNVGEKIIVEERKHAIEISAFAYLDGKNVMPLRMFAQDYKPAFDSDDTESISQFGGNLNTGGTGCYCPHKLFTPQLMNRIISEIINPFAYEVVYGELGWGYKGVLYFGLGLDEWGRLWVYEINVRHGDPEWEVLARKLSTDLFEIGMAVWNGTLDKIKQVWNQRYYVDVIAMEGKSKAARGWNKGYPGRYGKGHRIVGLNEVGKDIAIYFAGVDEDQYKGLVTFGGRVLHVVAGDLILENARKKAYENIRKIAFLDHYNDEVNCMRFREQIAL